MYPKISKAMQCLLLNIKAHQKRSTTCYHGKMSQLLITTTWFHIKTKTSIALHATEIMAKFFKALAYIRLNEGGREGNVLPLGYFVQLENWDKLWLCAMHKYRLNLSTSVLSPSCKSLTGQTINNALCSWICRRMNSIGLTVTCLQITIWSSWRYQWVCFVVTWSFRLAQHFKFSLNIFSINYQRKS